jgi:dolichol kinase
MSKILKYLNENHMAAIAALVLIAGAIYFLGCQSRVPSMIDPKKQITRGELEAESDFLIAQVRLKLEDLDRQDEIKRLISEQASLFATTGSFNPMGLANLAISVFAVGSALDSRRKLKAATAEKASP